MVESITRKYINILKMEVEFLEAQLRIKRLKRQLKNIENIEKSEKKQEG